MGTDSPTNTEATHRDQGALVLRRVARGFFRTSSPDAAASLTFYTVLALIPALIAAFSLIGIVGEKKDAVRAVLDIAKDVLPPDVLEGVGGAIEQVAAAAGAGWVLVASLAIALWSVARYVTGLGRAVNRIYGVPEGRMLWKAKPVHLLVTLAVFALTAVAVVIAALSRPLAQSVGAAVGAGEVALTIWRVVRWPALLFVVILVVAVLYYFAPNVAHPHFRLVSVGAIIAVALFALASVGFAAYVRNFADYDRLYGSFAGIMIFLVWLWIGNMALLLGALFDAELERIRELRAGMPAERDLQVELRDTSRVERNARNDAADERAARRFRRSRR
ncbi:YihY/virulence factor BrkB family protein [Microbacterium sp. H1-D42]|uniref:YihY/virulence factor BrkB family protein n=1 Tax=Microbacterium sp. H1-D42 TaxID=2925844 RepID=UPI001F53E1D9|nr:YihY/virulence factor BrkB family protein [Microbacterium sp. H1-D42]UNK72349.1 YihY/virulence factor BrkB family protein [Microbacterium sp. H1-D42]